MPSRVYQFEETALIGRWAEERVIDYFQNKGYLVQDVSMKKSFQVVDIDLAVRREESADMTFIEVKGDRYDSGNIYIETEYNGKPGCILFSEAEYLFYYFVNQGCALLIKLRDLRSWFNQVYRLYRTSSPRTPSYGRLVGSLGYIVPISDVLAGVLGVIHIAGLPVLGGDS